MTFDSAEEDLRAEPQAVAGNHHNESLSRSEAAHGDSSANDGATLTLSFPVANRAPDGVGVTSCSFFTETRSSGTSCERANATLLIA